jgi:arsenite/tail-anchored protein-transporting ATPase
MPLAAAVGAAPFIFVVGKGGTGKTTAAAAIALALADGGEPMHLLSTDPAHSVGALFGERLGGAAVTSPCTDLLALEELDAAAVARRFIRRATDPVSEIVERGTYLDAEDVAGFTRLALPGVDEMMALLRLVALADAGRRVVVDTAPTGHTLRLLDAGATQEGLARALRAMADKAGAVASSLARRPIRLAAESIIDELDEGVAAYRSRVLDGAAFIIAVRSGEVVVAETRRLAVALRARRLRVAAWVGTGVDAEFDAGAGDAAGFVVPLLDDPLGCDGLRAWWREIRPSAAATAAPAGVAASRAGRLAVASEEHRPVARPPGAARHAAGEAMPAAAGLPAAPWLVATAPRVLVFAGKGGVGKTTCAAAAALLLARSRDVVLCSADPAGSLDDVFGGDVTGPGRAGPRLRVVQVDAEAELRQWRGQHRADVLGALERIGLTDAVSLDRRVIEALLDLAPPGIDEFAALAAMLDAAASEETVVLDTAPTGHFLRLLTMPALALDWTRQLMRIMVKYRAAAMAEDAAAALLRTARELRGLQDLLLDATRAGVVVVTLDEPLVRVETERLVEALRANGTPVAARLVNRAGGPVDADADADAAPTLFAPLWPHPPAGPADLLDFAGTWTMAP